MCLLKHIGGAFKHRPEELKDRLSAKASDLVKRAFADVDPARLVDYHTHIAGIGTGDSANADNPKMRTWRHPFHRLKVAVYLSGAGVEHLEQADREFAARRASLTERIEGVGEHRQVALRNSYG